MQNQLFPDQATNVYHGTRIAKWAFVAMTILTIGRSVLHIFLRDGGAQSIATIALDAFPAAASDVVVGMFAQWGLSQIMLGVLYMIVLWRYQSFIPLMWSFVLLEWLGRLLLGFFKPFETVEQAPGAIGNMVIPVVALVMLALSLVPSRDNREVEGNDG